MIDPYAEVKARFADTQGVTVSSGTGAQGIKVGKKMNIMFHKGQLLVKLSPVRVSELINTEQGLPHDPGTGKPMKDRVLIPDTKRETWIGLCKESIQYEKSLMR